ncbi:endo-beta-N-acetylglucosaminidase [Georgenia alba]|uniref:Cytosolic endo-beta-N-acetylglucosaminidase TIM barrel domain-containing protein n=1 Tax=Georgenia alba TaxID=2233858 RepID=A0ABW2Q5R3_9MICO
MPVNVFDSLAYGRGLDAPVAPAFYPGPVPVRDDGVARRSILDWSPAADPDLPLLRSTVPLAARRPLDPARRPGPRVMSLAGFGRTGARSLQGGPTDVHYSFTHWDLLDLLVVWGGSSAEGLIVVPEAPVVDAGHRAGVPVLGTVFLPQREHGGVPEWTDELLARDDDGTFLLTGRLAEAAEVLGFDGWFVNAETQLEPDNGTSERARGTAAEMLAFVRDLGPRVDHLVWYDSMTREGRIWWQDGVTEENREFVARPGGAGPSEVFLNFNWAKRPGHVDATLARAAALGRAATDLFFGVDTESHGSASAVRWDALVEGGSPRGSIGLYRPEGSIRQLEDWSLEAFQETEARYWEPAPAGARWPGIGALVPRRSAHPLPVATTFTTGAGREYHVDGEPSGLGPWHHLGVQDPLPPERWAGRGHGLAPALDFDRAWQGGEALRLAPATEPGSVLVWRGPAGDLPDHWPAEVVAEGRAVYVLEVEDDGGTQRVALADAGPASGTGSWRRWSAVVPRAPRGSVTVRLEVTGPEPVLVGGLVLGEMPGTPPAAPTGLVAVRRPDGLLLTWDRDPQVHHWEVLVAGRPVGLASGGAFRLPAGTERAQVALRAVSARWERSSQTSPRS